MRKNQQNSILNLILYFGGYSQFHTFLNDCLDSKEIINTFKIIRKLFYNITTLKKKKNKKFYETRTTHFCFEDVLNFIIINLKQNCFIFGN